MADTQGDYRPLGWRTACAASAMGVLGLTFLCAAGVHLLGLRLLPRAVGANAEAVLRPYAQGLAVVAIVQFASFAICAIAFSIWFYRVNRNVTSFVGAGMRQSAGWAVGSLFVPFVNLYMPPRTMKDLFNACTFKVDPAAPGGHTKWQRAPIPFAVGLWWGAYIAGALLNLIGQGAQVRGRDYTSLNAGFVMMIVACFLLATAAWACAWCVLKLSRIQQKIFEGPEESAAPQTAASSVAQAA
jgi:hypothetical protein